MRQAYKYSELQSEKLAAEFAAFSEHLMKNQSAIRDIVLSLSQELAIAGRQSSSLAEINVRSFVCRRFK